MCTASEMPTYNLVPWLRSDGHGKKRNSILSMIAHDIYVIGTQESSVSEKDWIYKFRALLLENFGEDFTLVQSASSHCHRCRHCKLIVDLFTA